MSTRIFKFNLNNNYDQCGGGSLKQRGGGKFNPGDRVKVQSGDLGTVEREASINEFGLDLYFGNTYYVLRMDGGNKKTYFGVVNASDGRGGYNFVASESDLVSADSGTGGVLGGLVNGITGMFGALTGSSPKFSQGDLVTVSGEIPLGGSSSNVKMVNVVNKKGTIIDNSTSPAGNFYIVRFDDSTVSLEVKESQITKQDDIFLPSTSATSDMPSPSPSKRNLGASQTSSAMNLGPVPGMASETSSAFNTQINIPKRTSVTSSEASAYKAPTMASNKREQNLATLYAGIPKRTSQNLGQKLKGGFYDESLGQFGGSYEEKMINSYADIPKRRTPNFN